ncbi:hypothetical protein PIROE2DRAFT_1292 [Piromyces sp. E2]|nr:hypothetical protein PIROE2DRAFT_1292 [Piromyces sp. E2]|eukprot:OUM70434.1 hypothetical protein PIROE2DRAFT_1292 [Piromyces sp. E2]
MEDNKKSLKKLNKPSKLLAKQDTGNKKMLTDSNDNRKLKISDSVKSNKSVASIVAENDDNNISFMSYDDSNLSFMFRNDDSVIIRSKQKSDDNIENIVDTIHKLKETIDTVNDKKEKEPTSNNQDFENELNNKETRKSLEKFLDGSVNEEEILDNYFNNLINTPNNNSSEKPQQKSQRVIEVDEDVLSMTVGQYLEKVNKDIAKNLRIEGEEKIRDYYKQLFNIEDLYVEYLDKMVGQLKEYPKDKKILESQTKLMKNTLNSDRKSVKMEIETATDTSNETN